MQSQCCAAQGDAAGNSGKTSLYIKSSLGSWEVNHKVFAKNENLALDSS